MPDLTPAETLRAAASLMRERAEKATPGPWRAQSLRCGDVVVEQAGGPHLVADMPACGEHPGVRVPDADFIAGMHPAVALAVADWLDRFSDRSYCYGPAEFDHALAIARAYLGSPDE